MTWGRPLALVAALALPATAFAQAASPAVRVAEILEASGEVEISRGAGAPWTPARTGQELIGSDAVRTRASAFARIKFEAGLQWMLRAASQMELRAALAGAANANTIRVRLESGKAVASWTPNRASAARAGAAAPRAIVETPSGEASILGTEWSLNVEDNGRTALVVLTGSVELSNALGAVSVGANEAAEMRVGLPPTLLRVITPSDRVQWVADYSAQPVRYAEAAIGPARAEFDLAVADTEAGRPALAIDRLARMAANSNAAAGVTLAHGDLLIAAGELERARLSLEAGRARHPADARFDALLARVALFDGRTADSLALAAGATTKNPQSVEGWLALGETARSDGDGPTARRAFSRATVVNPDDARGWYGLGGVDTDYEAFVPARRWLNRALLIDPKGPGYRGEMGTVETLANNFGAAKREFAQALADRSGDYVALTGRALLALKEGREPEALDLLLRATLIEPRYARAHVYLGVTYHRLGRHDDAVRALRKASELDAKDPLPYLMQSAIYTDLYEPPRAMAAARTARDLMPNLKSLNQLASTQKGSANLGNSVAFMGMEQWSQHLAQESYYPFWAGSHLFLGDRYANEFARTSEYYQGLLADPTVFGGSPRFQTLLPRAGSYLSADISAANEENQFRHIQASLAANGYINRRMPIGYAVSARGGTEDGLGELADARRQPTSGSAAIGVAPSPTVSFFVSGAVAEEREQFMLGATGVRWATGGRHFDGGMNIRPSPTSSLAARVGRGAVEANIPIGIVIPTLSFSSSPAEVQVRYLTQLSEHHELSTGVELASDRQRVMWAISFVPESLAIDREMQSAQVFASLRSRWGRWLLQADLFGARELIEFPDRASGGLEPGLPRREVGMVQPRLGASIRMGPAVLRAAYQQRTRPWAAVSTLGPVATAGIPIDDDLLEAGGDQRRYRAQLEWELSSRSFVSVFAEHQDIKNRHEFNELEDTMAGLQKELSQHEDGDGRDTAAAIGDLRDIARDASRLNVTALSLLEGHPDVVDGHASAAGAAVNHVLTAQVSLSAHYAFRPSSGISLSAEQEHQVSNQSLTYLPRHLFSFGSTWVSPKRVYLSGEAVYRSARFTVESGSDGVRATRAADWTARVAGTWESRDKRWAVELSGFDLLARSRSASYQLTARIRR